MNIDGYLPTVDSWMRARNLRLTYCDNRHYSILTLCQDSLPYVLPFSFVGAACVSGISLQSLGVDESVIAPCALVAGLVTTVGLPTLLYLRDRYKDKICDENATLLLKYNWHEIVSSKDLFKIVNTCNTKMREIILGKLNHVQLEGVKQYLIKEPRKNLPLLSLVEKYSKEEEIINISEEEAKLYEKDLVLTLLEQVLNGNDYAAMLKACRSIYRSHLEKTILSQLDIDQLFDEKDNKLLKNLLSFVGVNNFDDIKNEINVVVSERVTQEHIRKIEQS